MASSKKSTVYALLVWCIFLIASAVPILVAASSPLAAWRNSIYIIAGLAGVIAMVLMLAQPMLIGGYLPGLSPLLRRRIHRRVGSVLVAAIVVHVAGLWITSPPDVIDVLLFRSPTPFSLWGAIAMWAVFATSLLAILRARLRTYTWRLGHVALVIIAVAGSVVHAWQIEGTMGTVSKTVLCLMIILATLRVIFGFRSRFVRVRRPYHKNHSQSK